MLEGPAFTQTFPNEAEARRGRLGLTVSAPRRLPLLLPRARPAAAGPAHPLPAAVHCIWRSLVGELKSHVPCGVAKTKNSKKQDRLEKKIAVLMLTGFESRMI